MTSCLKLGGRLIKNETHRLQIDNVDLEKEVGLFKAAASQKLNKYVGDLEFTYAGMLLDDEVTLSAYGIVSGVTIFVHEKIVARQTPLKPVNEKELEQMIASFEHLLYRNAIQRPLKQEIIDKVIASTPSLKDDPAAVAILLDHDLLASFSDSITLRRAIAVHPALFEALQHFLVYVKDTQFQVDSSQAGTSSGYAYSLDALSDDDEEMEAGEQPNMVPLQRNTSYSAITTAQLAAAIANATANFSSTGAVINSPPTAGAGGATTPSSASNTGSSGSGVSAATGGGATSGSTGGSGIITYDMFENALQQAFNSTPDGEETMESIRTRLEPQLRQMREMGLVDEARNIRALQATSGDVQAAIDLVFNGVID